MTLGVCWGGLLYSHNDGDDDNDLCGRGGSGDGELLMLYCTSHDLFIDG